eukprot:scaffold1833_cov255-Pinguiococcus_pyrenoidosus.AAC.18
MTQNFTLPLPPPGFQETPPPHSRSLPRTTSLWDGLSSGPSTAATFLHVDRTAAGRPHGRPRSGMEPLLVHPPEASAHHSPPHHSPRLSNRLDLVSSLMRSHFRGASRSKGKIQQYLQGRSIRNSSHSSPRAPQRSLFKRIQPGPPQNLHNAALQRLTARPASLRYLLASPATALGTKICGADTESSQECGVRSPRRVSRRTLRFDSYKPQPRYGADFHRIRRFAPACAVLRRLRSRWKTSASRFESAEVTGKADVDASVTVVNGIRSAPEIEAMRVTVFLPLLLAACAAETREGGVAATAQRVVNCGDCPAGTLGSCVFPTLLNETAASYSLHCTSQEPICEYPGQSAGPGNLSSLVVYAGVTINLAEDCEALLWDLSAADNSSITLEAGSSVNGRQISFLASHITVHNAAAVNTTGRALGIGASTGYGGSGAGSGGRALSDVACANEEYVMDKTVFAEYYSVDPFESYSLTGNCAVSTGANVNTSAAGGCILLTGSSTVTMNGVLESNGASCGTSRKHETSSEASLRSWLMELPLEPWEAACDFGGGGGSIGIATKTLKTTDTSHIWAVGGDGNQAAGGGGRIALKYDSSQGSSTVLGAILSAGGRASGNCGRGGAGTVLTKDVSDATANADLVLSARGIHMPILAVTAFDTEKELGAFNDFTILENTTLASQALGSHSLEIQRGSRVFSIATGSAAGEYAALAITAVEMRSMQDTSITASDLTISSDGEQFTDWVLDAGTVLRGAQSVRVTFFSSEPAHFGAQIKPDLQSDGFGEAAVLVQNSNGDLYLDQTAELVGSEVRIYATGDLFLSGTAMSQAQRCNRSFRLDACTADGLSTLKKNATLSIDAAGGVSLTSSAFVSGSMVIIVSAEPVSMDKGARIRSDALGFAAATGPGAGQSAETTSAAGGGAGYGGDGGAGVSETGTVTDGGVAYGTRNAYALCGSGGGDSALPGDLGGSGGGTVYICSLAQLQISANISANGAPGNSSAGGGSGGSIALVGPKISGAGGALHADGGRGGHADGAGAVPSFGGGGAGGRILLSIDSSSSSNAVEYTPSKISISGALSGEQGSSEELGKGESGTILFPSCPPGFGNQLSEPYAFCELCGAGRYSESLDAAECSYCSNAPTHSSYTGTGQVSNACPYSCNVGFSPPDCKKPLDSILDSIGGWYVLVILIVAFLAFFLLVVAMWRHYLQKRRQAYAKDYYLDESTVFNHVFISERLRTAEEAKSASQTGDLKEHLLDERRPGDPFLSHQEVSGFQRLSRKADSAGESGAASDRSRSLFGFPHEQSEPDNEPGTLVTTASAVLGAFLSLFDVCGVSGAADSDQDGRSQRSSSMGGRTFAINLGIDYRFEKELLSHKLTTADLPYHAGRIVLSGTNTPDNPWLLNPGLPGALRPILDEVEWKKLAVDLNCMARWPFMEEAFLRAVQLVCNPVYHLLLEGQQRSRALQLFRLLSSYDHAAFKGTQAQLDHCLRLTMSSDCTVACLDILHKEGPESPYQPLTQVGQPAVPILFRFSGLATYCCPLCLDPNDVLVKAIPHMPSLSFFIMESWSELLKGLNEELRLVSWRSLKRLVAVVVFAFCCLWIVLCPSGFRVS